ncbi:unnamed protein product [Miscanthus lutarioriparius]|uniref:Uncharacterized protein n=1 Tax=Miscanthus lutarioriparius TaxID=422564 RepID=A0A811P3L6_9POAL|nr:unnamed protein product [Miscanthus lutarioriparius]
MESSSSKDGLNKSPILQRLTISRPHGSGTKGNQIRLHTNHFKVSVHSTDVIFYHYNVNLKYEDDKPVQSKGVGRTVIDKLQDIYLANVNFAYDGEKNLFTMCALQNVKDEFIVVVEDGSSAKTTRSRIPGGNGSPEGSDTKRMKRPMPCKTYKVELKSVGKIPLSAIDKVMRGQESDDCQEALQVLEIILRQKSAKQLNDVSTTMIVEPGPVINFILSNQYIKDPCRIDWGKAKRALRNLRIKTTHTNSEFKISSLSEKSCYEQKLPLKQRNGNGSDFVEITVYDYYLKHWEIRLQDSANFPCLDVGKPKRPTYLPIELCHLVSLQRYTKALTALQRSSLVQSSRKNPRERKSDLSGALQRSNYSSDDMLKKYGISIASEFALDGRVLQAPKLKAGDGQDLIARDGRWNFMNRKPIEAKGVDTWAVVNFTTKWNLRDLQDLVRRLINCGGNKGIIISPPQSIFEERLQRNASAASRVDDMLEQIGKKIERSFVNPQLSCCVFFQIRTVTFMLGGLNSFLEIERNQAIPSVEGSNHYLWDGVSEGQFNQVLNIELAQIIEACKFIKKNKNDNTCLPKFTVIVAQKNHHTRLFRDGNDTANVPAEQCLTPITNQRVSGGLEERQDFRRCLDRQLTPRPIMISLLEPQSPCLQCKTGEL